MSREEQLYSLTVLAEHAARTARLIQEQVNMLAQSYEQEDKKFVEYSWYDAEGNLTVKRYEVE